MPQNEALILIFISTMMVVGLLGFHRTCRTIGWVVVLVVAFVLYLPRMVIDTADELRDVANWIVRQYRMKK